MARRVKRPPCPTCGSRKWRQLPDSGALACKEGHIFTTHVNETTETNFNSQVRQRSQKKGLSSLNVSGKRVKETVSLERSFATLIQVFQIILRKQSFALTKAIPSIPRQEFDQVLRDLWAVYVNSLAAPLEKEREQEQDQVQDQVQENNNEGHQFAADVSGSPSTRDLSSSSSSSSSDDDSDVDNENENSNNDNKNATPAPQDTIQDLPTPSTQTLNAKKVIEAIALPRMPYTVVLLYLACLQLRLPIFINDIRQLCLDGIIPYIHAHKSISKETLSQLNRSHRAIVCRITALSMVNSTSHTLDITSGVNAFINFYALFDVKFPHLNAYPLIWRACLHMALPPMAYEAAIKILSLVPHDEFTNNKISSFTGLRVVHSNVFPDSLIMGSIIVAIKLLWGFDGKDRAPENFVDPASQLPRFEDWFEAFTKLHQSDHGKRDYNKQSGQKAIEAKNSWEMTNEEIDDYLDYCESILVPPNASRTPNNLPSTMVKFLDEYYPLHNQDGQSGGKGKEVEEEEEDTNEKYRQDLTSKLYKAGLRPRPNSSTLHPAQNYTFTKGSGKDFSNYYAKVLEIAANFISQAPSGLNNIVYMVESKFLRDAGWSQRKRAVTNQQN